MAAKYSTFTLDETVVAKLNWIMNNTHQDSKSGLVAHLIEREWFRINKLKVEEEARINAIE